MDFEASVDRVNDAEKGLKEEIAQVKEQLKGKDQAIQALGDSLLEKANEQEKMSEKFNSFKNRLMLENCFHT